MLNLSDDIAEMFGALDGRALYMERLERWLGLEVDRRRYDKEARDRYKDLALGVYRKRRYCGPIALVHGSYYAYAKGGCRCIACRRASAGYQSQRRARLRSAVERAA